MKVHQMLSHMKRNNATLKIRPQDVRKLIEYKGEIADYLEQQKLITFFKTHFPEFTHPVHIRLNRYQQAILTTYKRPVSYLELANVHTWWDGFAKLPKKTFPRLDQYDPLIAAKGYLEQEQLIEQIGSVKTGIKNPQTRNHDLLVVVGTATGYDAQLTSITEPHDTMAVNGAAMRVHSDFFYSIHGSYLKQWKPHAANPQTKTICEWWIPGVDSGYGIFNEELIALNMFHYSGNMAALTGILMGYPRVLMVGCPLAPIETCQDLRVHNGKVLEIDTWKETLVQRMPQIQDHFVKGTELFPEIKERVRSISGGFTEQFLGRSWEVEVQEVEVQEANDVK